MHKKGFTLIEIVTVMGILTILFSFTVPQLFRLRDRNTLQTSAIKLVSDLRTQQLSAMHELQLRGVYFEQSRYVLFTGEVYSEGNAANTIITLDYPLQFINIQLPGSQIVFASGSGEIVSFDPYSRSIILRDSLNLDQKIVQFNEFGVPVNQ